MSTQEPIKQNRVGFKRNADGKFEPYLAGSIPATIVGGVEQTAPRVTIEQIEAEIESEHYFTAWDGVMGELASDGVLPTVYDNDTTAPCLQRTLFCVLTLNNGMRVEGVNHGSVSATNYSAELGKKYAREAAIEKLWPVFGFELAQKLYRERQEAGDGLVTMRVSPEVLHQAESAEALKMNLDTAGVPTKSEQGYEYSLWGRVQVFAGTPTNEPTISSLGSAEGMFRKKPVVIKAVQYGEYGKLVKGMCNSQSCYSSGNTAPHVHTAHNNQMVLLEVGDWVIPEPDGEHYYPCKPDIFAATYEAA